MAPAEPFSFFFFKLQSRPYHRGRQRSEWNCAAEVARTRWRNTLSLLEPGRGQKVGNPLSRWVMGSGRNCRTFHLWGHGAHEHSGIHPDTRLDMDSRISAGSFRLLEQAQFVSIPNSLAQNYHLICFSHLRESILHIIDGSEFEPLLVSGSRDRTIKVWSGLTGRNISSLKLPTNTGYKRDRYEDQNRSRAWVTICWPPHCPRQFVTSSYK